LSFILFWSLSLLFPERLCNLMKFNYHLCNYLKCKFDDLLVNRIIMFDFHILNYIKVLWKFLAHECALTFTY
jgi:hypothetical protein